MAKEKVPTKNDKEPQEKQQVPADMQGPAAKVSQVTTKWRLVLPVGIVVALCGACFFFGKLWERTSALEREFERDYRSITEDIGTLKKDMATLRTDTSVLAHDVATVVTNTSTLKQDMTTLRGEIHTDIYTVRDATIGLREELHEDTRAIQDEIARLREQMHRFLKNNGGERR